MLKFGGENEIEKILSAMLVGTTLAQIAGMSIPVSASSDELKPLKLQYDEAAPYDPKQAIDSSTNRNGWERWALPIGNGHMGAMIFGGTDVERIQMNEETLWTGGPGGNTEELVDNKDPLSDVYGNVNAYESGAMGAYIEDLFKNYYSGTKQSSPATEGDMKILPNNRIGLGAYTNFAELYLDINHTGAKNYNRELDLRTGLSTVTHTYKGVEYTRKTFASYPDNVIVYSFFADKSASVSVTVRAEIPYNHTSGTMDKDDRGNDGREGAVVADLSNKTLHLDGVLDNGMKFSGDFYVLPTGGKMTVAGENNDQFRIENADSVMIIVALATNYKNDYPSYRQEDADYSRKNVEARISAVANKTFAELYTTHFNDYNVLFSRVEMDLGGVYDPDQTTNELLLKWLQASTRNLPVNHYLEELYFQYGRYLLISSSREDSLPANLQGVWADQKRPMWQSDYHTNINLQMNYWPAYTTNLAESGEALVSFVNSLQEPGAVTAKMLFGVENTWMVNVSANPFGYTGNCNANASLSPTASAFLLQNVYDAYQFTKDKEQLESTIYPMMKSACNLFINLLRPGRTESDKDKLYMVPSFSPEHGTWTVGATYDQQLIYMLFADTVDAAKTLGVDEDFVTQLEDMMARLDPIQIGASGQIKEYQYEGGYLMDTRTGKQIQSTDKAHRHNSQLMALYPGNLITTENTKYLNAAKTTLLSRGNGGTGWSLGQKFTMWARVGDGNHAYNTLFLNLMKTGTYTNLFDGHPPFQIDGNFGATAGITELLLQSHAGYIDLLPALPDALSDGNVSGLVAEGNFVVDMQWREAEITSLNITARSGGTLCIKAGNMAKIIDRTTGEKVSEVVQNENGSIAFATNQGHTYSFEYADAEADIPMPEYNAPIDNTDNDSNIVPIIAGITGGIALLGSGVTAFLIKKKKSKNKAENI